MGNGIGFAFPTGELGAMPGLARFALSPFGSARSELLPRVRDVIRRHDAESERFIGWAQLGVVLFFGALYAIAPRPDDAPLFGPVPFALAFYFLFTALRLFLSYRIMLPTWFLVTSMLVDVTMLLGLIWSFHLQYGQPAPFYLKVPTFSYIFVFIALRALRFDARFVVGTGIFAALGWVALTLYAVQDSGTAVTRSFVEYISSNSILIGAEVDKVVAILVVTAILALAIQRAGRVLARAVKEEARARDMVRFLPRDVADVITSGQEVVQPGDAEEREAAVLIIDLRGFTRFCAALPPRDVVATLVGFHKRIVPIVTGHEGVVDKYMGDGVMATFGAVRSSPTAAADALRALEAIILEARSWQASLVLPQDCAAPRVNGAMAAGPVVFAALGDEERLEFTIIGEAVNLCTKLEKHNKVERTAALARRADYELARAQGFMPRTEPEIRSGRRVAGIADAIDLVVLAADGTSPSDRRPGDRCEVPDRGDRQSLGGP
jgi:adenylate cyclase